MASAAALEWVRSFSQDPVSAARILGRSPRDLDNRLLLVFFHLTRAWMREAVMATDALPTNLNWSRLSDAADAVAHDELGTIEAIAQWLDDIQDPDLVAVFLLLRWTIRELGREIRRRVEERPVEHAYIRVASGDPQALDDLTRLLRIRRTTWTGQPFPEPMLEEIKANAFERVIILFRAAVTLDVDNVQESLDLNPVRALQPMPPGWAEVAGAFLHEDIARAFEDHLPALEGALQDAPAHVRREQEATRKREQYQRALLQAYDPVDTRAEKKPSVLDQLEETERKAKQAERLDAIEAEYPPVLWRAVIGAIRRELTDQEAATQSDYPLRTFQLRKAEIRRRLEGLAVRASEE